MTSPNDFNFVDSSVSVGDSVSELGIEPENDPLADNQPKFPPAILDGISEEKLDEFLIWIDQYLNDLLNDQSERQDAWDSQEEAYRAKSVALGAGAPFKGASNETTPVIAMAVDPIHARLDTGIFKQDPVFSLKGLVKQTIEGGKALEQWIEYYQKHKLKLRQIASPRLLEMTKLGTMIFKTVYDREERTHPTYDQNNGWKVVKKKNVVFSGPRVFGVSIGDLLFPPSYQHIQDVPIVAERQRVTFDNLKVAEASGKLTNVDKIKGQETPERTKLEDAREEAAGHKSSRRFDTTLEVFEVWCKYDIDGDGLPENLVLTYHARTRTVLQLRYNWYFSQRYPYTTIPYTIVNDSLYGMGICEMVEPFQEALTKWDRMARDNAYLANIRMFIVKKESGVEDVPRLYAGRCFFVDDPKTDFIPFGGGDIYPSTLAERQNLFGLVEKRTGVSDYLTGRESPIIGSRATATSTLALIQEGTKRVEEVLENVRVGFAEIIENCIYIWIQYGLEGLDDVVFGNSETQEELRKLFNNLSIENVNGALAIDLTATDASGNRQVVQQLQLQIIQSMMIYLEKILEAGGLALQAQQSQPQLAKMVEEVMRASRTMFKDLLHKYDIRNPDDYLPDLEKFLNGQSIPPTGPFTASQGGVGTPGGLPGGLAGQQVLPTPTGQNGGQGVPTPAIPGLG